MNKVRHAVEIVIDADEIARFIFNRHDENFAYSGEASRVAFMVLGTDGVERQSGGLSEGSLAAWIQDAINAQLSSGSGISNGR